MADLSDVEAALVAVIGAALYPNGSTSPSAIPGHDSKVFRGWPLPDQLDQDLKAGLSSVSVFPQPGVTRNTTRFLPHWEDGPLQQPTMTVILSSQTGNDVATFSGVGVAGMCVGIRRQGRAYSARMNAGDGPALAAARLAALVPGAAAFGSSLTAPRSAGFLARVGMPRTARRELRRVKQGFTISVWSPDPAARDAVSTLVDASLGGRDWLALPDGTAGRLEFTTQSVIDGSENAGSFRRDMNWSVEYALYDQRLCPVVMFGVIDGSLAAPGTDGALAFTSVV